MKKIVIFMSLLFITITLSACEENTNFTITFLGFDNVLIEERVIDTSNDYDIEYPDAPHVDNHLFVEWDTILEEITEDVTIRAIYEPFNAALELEELLEKVLNSTNYHEHVDIYVSNVLDRTITYAREEYAIYMVLNRSNADQLRLYIDRINGDYVGYEYQVDGWVSTTLNESTYNAVRFTHSQRRMLPSQIDIDWFTVDGNAYTVKLDAYQDINQYIPMDGFFHSYKMIVHEDALEVKIEVYQGFQLIRYEILFDGFNTTTVDIDLNE